VPYATYEEGTFRNVDRIKLIASIIEASPSEVLVSYWFCFHRELFSLQMVPPSIASTAQLCFFALFDDAILFDIL